MNKKHERIWLEPAETGEEHPDGRLWCQDNVWGDEADEYILASSVATLQSEIAALKAALSNLLTTAKLLHANSLGCVSNHCAADFAEMGLPGWLIDCGKSIEAASTLNNGGSNA